MPVKVKFQSEWGKRIEECHFPDGMPKEMRIRAINRRRQIMVYAYLSNGIGQDLISFEMFSRICRELEQLQAAWGYEFGFYDFQFVNFDESKEDHLFTNLGIDEGLNAHAMALLATRKKYERSLAA